MKLLYGVGLNDADYEVAGSIGGVKSRCPYYFKWTQMLRRCYSAKWHEHKPQYANCIVHYRWRRFSNFRKWLIKQNYKTHDDVTLELDKDLLFPGNVVYAPKRCLLLPREINGFLVTSNKAGSAYPGVFFEDHRNKFRANISNPLTGKREFLGRYDSEKLAYRAWLERKQELANQLSDSDFVTSDRVRKALRVHFQHEIYKYNG